MGQLPADAEVFARYLRELTGLVDTRAGWCGVFWQRDPDGMRACLDGAELPPWDVLEGLLQDLAAGHGTVAAEGETVRARALHAAAAIAHDRRPGGREALVERLGAMRREEAYAAECERELAGRLRASGGGSQWQGLDVELAWARDDHERATARCAELSARLAALLPAQGRPPAPESWFRAEAGKGWGGEEAPQARPGRAPASKRRPRGARYAGLDDGDGNGVFGAPAMPAPAAQAAAPRGARYAGVEEAGPPPAPADSDAVAQDPRAVSDTVATLVQLRAQGRTGEAHVLLCEAAGWPAARLPLLAGALHRAGLGADWATLLWEVASLPPDRVVAVAAALDGAGLGEDGRQLLRQGVVRPAAEIAAALLALDDSGGREREVRALVEAFVRVRTPEDVAQVARSDPRRLSPLLLDAARQVSHSRYRDVVHALRVAGAAP